MIINIVELMLTLGVCVSLTVFMSDVTNGKVWLYWGFIDEWHLSTYSHLHYHTLLSLSQFGSVLYSFSSHSTARIIYINTAAYSGAVKTCLNKFKLADTWKCVAVGIWLDILWPDCDICHFTCIAFFDDTIVYIYIQLLAATFHSRMTEYVSQSTH